jgi:pimeloyl-ACP methyl ester carboxylesterase
VFLRDVHHYLFDATFTPRPGETFRIRRDVRERAVVALREAAGRPRPHVVVGHSLGSVVAYDVMTGLDDLSPVDALITVGSPLGLDDVQEGLAPPWTRDDGWPSRALPEGAWVNIGDPLDPVCGFDREIGPDFRREGALRVRDVGVLNHGSWRHSIGKYLGQPALRMSLLDALR